jgi:hypothetical protein
MRIALIYRALEKGIPLPDDEAYTYLLEQYPYYQKILKDR